MHQTLQKARDQKKLTNAQISRALGVSESLICKIMNGARAASDDIRPRLFNLLGIQASDRKRA